MSPTQAVRPVPPKALRWALNGTPGRSGIRRISSGETTAWVRQALRWPTISPTARAGVRDSITRPSERPSSGALSSQWPSSIAWRM